MRSKPPECAGCPLHTRGKGFAPLYGNQSSPLAIIAEALGKTEAERGEPLVGEAGVYWQRALTRLRATKPQFLIANTVNCQPPNDWLAGAPWEHSAIAHCRVHRGKLYWGAKVYLTMGVIATRTVLKELLNIDYAGELENWHGYVIGEPPGPYIVPTFHPSYLLRGNHNLFGTILYDMQRAMEVASFGFGPRSEPSLVVDPPPAWFEHYVSQIPDDPEAWLAVDTETTTKAVDEAASETGVGKITRFNLAMNRDQGVTVPAEERYFHSLDRALLKRCTKLFWNERYDIPILEREQHPVGGETWDGMWAWHLLHSDIPKGLGFVAPFCSDLQPWKHLSSTEPGPYAALDAVQTYRCFEHIVPKLKSNSQWETFLRFVPKLDHQAIYPMERIGPKLSRSQLAEMQKSLTSSLAEAARAIQQLVPEEALPTEGGWKREPKPEVWPGAFKKTVRELVLMCTICGEAEVGPAHNCQKRREANA